jgi:hypothetical protein
MNGLHLDPMVAMLGVVGAVVLTAALLSGAAERTRFPQVLSRRCCSSSPSARRSARTGWAW